VRVAKDLDVALLYATSTSPVMRDLRRCRRQLSRMNDLGSVAKESFGHRDGFEPRMESATLR